MRFAIIALFVGTIWDWNYSPKRWTQFILGLTSAVTVADHILDSYDTVKAHNLFSARPPPNQILGNSSRKYSYSSALYPTASI
eukprot:scaffold102431_cov57-Attheya_sp.AAC.3